MTVTPGPLSVLEVQSSHSRRVKQVPTLPTTESGVKITGEPITPGFTRPSAVQGTLLTVLVGLLPLALRPADHTQPIKKAGTTYLPITTAGVTLSGISVTPRPLHEGVRVVAHHPQFRDHLIWGDVLVHHPPMM